MGRAIKDRHDDVVLATKFGPVSHAGGGSLEPGQQPRQHPYRDRRLSAAARL